MGSILKVGIVNMEISVNSLKKMTMMEWVSMLSFGCVMLLTLFRFGTTWSDSESQMAWYITSLGLVAVGVTVLRKQNARWSSIDVLVLLYSLYLLVNVVFVSHYPLAHQTMMIGQCVLLYVFVRLIITDGGNVSQAMICFMMMAGVYESVLGMMQLMGIKDTYTDSMQVTGTFFNSGPLGIYIAVMLSICTCHYLRTRNKIIGFAVVVMLMGLCATWSRTAWLAYGIVLILLFKSLVIRHWRIALLLFVGIIITLYFVKQGSADSRALMNIVAFKEWKLHPWWGYGLGGYVHALAHGQIEFFRIHSDSAYVACTGATNLAFNEYLKVMVEQGLIGLVFMLSILGFSLFRLYRKHSPFFYAMFALCFAALFSYPFHLFPFMLLITLFVAIAADGENCDMEIGLGRKVLAVASLIIFISFSFFVNREVDRRVEISNDAKSFSYMHNAAFIDDYFELLPWMNDDREYLFNFGKVLREAGRYNDSNAILRMETKLDTDPMAYVLMGRNYEDLNLYDEADSLYRMAFLLQPNRIYPLYRQLKLYEKMGSETRIMQKAHEMASFNPKIMSPAVDEMKGEALKFLNPNN